MMFEPDPYDDDVSAAELDEMNDEFTFDCHMDRNGYCGLAGTEECDFDCPYRNVKRN